jgi:hypothetical protein
MTRPNPPTSRGDDRQFARDVAKQLDRRRMARKATLWTGLLALIAAAAMYLRCGSGIGLGGIGQGTGEASAPLTPTHSRPCTLRVTATGITVNGKAMQRDDAVAACKAATGADVVVTGDARQGDWEDLRGALEAAGIKDIVVHQPPVGSGAH